MKSRSEFSRSDSMTMNTSESAQTLNQEDEMEATRTLINGDVVSVKH